MKHVTIYHNPHCSKSRECLALLKQRGVDANVVLYLETPQSNLLKALDFRSARDLMRKKEDLYQELKLADTSLSEQQLLTETTEYPKLVERPIVVAGGKARIGRPAEQVLEIL
ncbi:arsenate reductase (glutaredoxin) [Serratia symbiotica]|uniref:arsenate reductase (glutaredoxin) n=1 Tax=Serratia symbiotica TaxID=138074 RepID=UPI001D5686FE|nr:arsenate reductase (glutaredoxin) [Serratia symbiotica]MCX2957348.1 arsenate reductase (glutaredoxin) [Serratia symbiotica]NIG87174.1 arsenate reductase (glutaredoxin) [Serratia symbiotica]USS96728.1 arsenate reductase (glutaredoxin) [Serratia symbiotica]